MNLEIDTTLAVISVLATIAIGYIGVKYTLKHRKQTEIIFLKNSSISLFKTIVKNFDDIEINFKGKKIDENLIVFKGTFINSGNTDIDQSLAHKPLKIELPNNYYWVNHNLIDSSKGLEISSSTQDNKLVFDWSLFKEGEYFTFDSLIEHKTPEKNLYKYSFTDISRELVSNIQISHRITNLRKIKRINTIQKPMPLVGVIFLSIFILVFVISAGYVSYAQFSEYKVLNEVNISSNSHFVKIDIKNKDEILLIDKNEKIIKHVSINELQQAMTNNIKITKDNINYWELGFLCLSTIAFLIFWIIILISQFKKKELFKKLKTVLYLYDDFDFEEHRLFEFWLFDIVKSCGWEGK